MHPHFADGARPPPQKTCCGLPVLLSGSGPALVKLLNPWIGAIIGQAWQGRLVGMSCLVCPQKITLTFYPKFQLFHFFPFFTLQNPQLLILVKQRKIAQNPFGGHYNSPASSPTLSSSENQTNYNIVHLK